MLLKLLLIIFGIPILVLPLIGDILKERKITKIGYYFILFVILFTVFQIVNENLNSKSEKLLKKEKFELRVKVDSLNLTATHLRDSISNLKNILTSIDNQLYVTNNELIGLGQLNDSLNKKIYESDRPLFHLTSTELKKSNKFNTNYVIEIHFGNEGIRAATNVYGDMYTIHGDTIWNNGTLAVSKSDVYPNNRGFTIHAPMKFNPDTQSLKEAIYYYFRINYSDIATNQLYPYEVVMKLNPFEKGNYLKELVLCRNWEESKIKKMI